MARCIAIEAPAPAPRALGTRTWRRRPARPSALMTSTAAAVSAKRWQEITAVTPFLPQVHFDFLMVNAIEITSFTEKNLDISKTGEIGKDRTE
ncbi:hypothetical protein EVAR_31758_1 [Eumeta japonica]|uniref:Uncharacterized protein n=1 Tax=Eumeta variegata TaxID=151549 RepID=A0A4C1W4C7_EUMVA|nr:hypothetical protein EVAR_31758_1 [Eumeta japonica]